VSESGSDSSPLINIGSHFQVEKDIKSWEISFRKSSVAEFFIMEVCSDHL
jgi:hypothetical protein